MKANRTNNTFTYVMTDTCSSNDLIILIEQLFWTDDFTPSLYPPHAPPGGDAPLSLGTTGVHWEWHSSIDKILIKESTSNCSDAARSSHTIIKGFLKGQFYQRLYTVFGFTHRNHNLEYPPSLPHTTCITRFKWYFLVRLVLWLKWINNNISLSMTAKTTFEKPFRSSTALENSRTKKPKCFRIRLQTLTCAAPPLFQKTLIDSVGFLRVFFE